MSDTGPYTPKFDELPVILSRSGAAVAVLLAGTSVLLFSLFAGGGDGAVAATTLDSTLTTISGSSTSATSATTSTTIPDTTTTTEPLVTLDRWSDSSLVGEPYGTEVEGLLTFRGNPTRTYYGEGPVPEANLEVAVSRRGDVLYVDRPGHHFDMVR